MRVRQCLRWCSGQQGAPISKQSTRCTRDRRHRRGLRRAP
jgi:hypothetical protein